jgi:hypothetical protein
VAEASRDEQKLWLILFQIKAIRARLNSLAVQRGLFWTLALGIGAAAGIVGAALTLGPLFFLTIAVMLGIAAVLGSIIAARSAWRMRANPAQAAAIADSRADLKGRLATVQALAASGHHSFLWPYLVEDTYGARESFEPARVEPRWLSRSFWALLVALLLAGLLFEGGLADRTRGQAVAGGGGVAAGAVTADINNLDIRPADPSLSPNAEIYADPATLKKLQDRIAQQNAANGSLSKLVDKARSFADAIQNDIAGRSRDDQPPVQMRLTDKSGRPDDGSGGAQSKPPNAQANARGNGGGGASLDNQGSAQNQPPTDGSAPPSTGLAANPGTPGSQSPADTQTGQPPDSTLADGEGQGSDHGSGSDPSSLFGEPSQQQLGADNFKIAIDAVPSTEASGPGSPGYLPPKVRAPINPSQYPDEPLARASIPEADQMTIKRVFDR